MVGVVESPKNPYTKGKSPRLAEKVEPPLDPLLLQPPDVRKCTVDGHYHYDARWGGCPLCGDRGVPKLQKEIAVLKSSVESWKEAWHVQREATGQMAWEIPIPTYMSHVPIDPRVFEYFREIERLLEGFFRVLSLARTAEPA